MKLRTLFKLLSLNLKNIYIIQEINKEGTAENEYYFKRNKNRLFVYENLLMEEVSSHYNLWCDHRDYSLNGWS